MIARKSILSRCFTIVTCVLMLCILTASESTRQTIYAIPSDLKQEKLYFDEDGNLVMTTYDRKASSLVKYRTIGWTIKRYKGELSGNQFVRMKLSQVGESQTDSNDSNYVFTKYQCSKDDIFQEIAKVSEEWLNDWYENGGTVYLDAIMTVVESGKVKGSMDEQGIFRGEVYDTLSGIQGARAWADKSVLVTHFNKSVYFKGNPKLLEGHYWVSYVEAENGDFRAPVSMYGGKKDIIKKKLKKKTYEIEAEDFSKDGYVFLKSRINYEDFTGKKKQTWSDSLVEFSNKKARYKKVEVYFYYSKEKTDEDSLIFYGQEEVSTGNTLRIDAQELDAPEFDVEQGIPTGEYAGIHGKLQKYYFTGQLVTHSGAVSVPVIVNVTYTVVVPTEKGPMVSSVVIPNTVYVSRDYQYYTLEQLELFLLDGAYVENQSLGCGRVNLSPIPKIPVNYETNRASYVQIPTYYGSCYGGILGSGGGVSNAELLAIAERAAGDVYVRNDTLHVDGDVILDGTYVAKQTKKIQLPDGMKEVSFRMENYLIPHTKANGYYPSNAKASYKKYDNNHNEQQSKTIEEWEINEINDVIVHTPVVCHGFVTDDIAHNQELIPTTRDSLILGRDFTITVETNGTHLPIKGYQTRSYEKYVEARQVRFPFPVYNKNQYVAANEWITMIGKDQSFYLPIGVDEGDYVVRVRVMARNVLAGNGMDKNEVRANLSSVNYGAMEDLPVHISGRLYDLAITDVVDYPRWYSVFHDTSGEQTGNTYRVGILDVNGDVSESRSNSRFAPILPGSHPYRMNAGAVGLGYRVKYELRTIGSMRGDEARIILMPTYYYLSRDGKERKKVRVYSQKNLEEYGAAVVLTKENRNYESSYYHNVADVTRCNQSIQRWEGEYQIPADVYLVDASVDIHNYVRSLGGKIKQTDPVFLKDGYLLVAFQIISSKDGVANLSYLNLVNERMGYCNMWRMQGFAYNRMDNRGNMFSFTDGDFLIYDTKYTIYNDYMNQGTH